MKRFLLAVGIAIAALIAVLLVRTFTVTSMQIDASPAPAVAIDRNAAIARFSRAIQFRTVSAEPEVMRVPQEFAEERRVPDEFYQFVSWLAEAYPRVYASLRREPVGGRTQLFTWTGSDPKLKPILLMGHYDVVPVDPATVEAWKHPPFSGAVADGFIWGRGALDDKFTVITILEAAETLLRDGWQPKRTIYFSFGHDEELTGLQGAANVAKLLAERGVKLEAVIDEGGVVMNDAMPGIDRPVALIGIAEKGVASVELLATGSGGHSSMPPPRTEVGAIAAAVDRIQSRPFDGKIDGAAAEMFRWLAPEMPFARRVVLSNLWLFRPLLPKTNSMNAMQRTTIAPTMVSGGVKSNVIPAEARAVVNFRILPGDSVEGVVSHVKEAIDDEHVSVKLSGPGWEPSLVSDPRAPQFRALQKTIRQVYPKVVVAPYLVIGATDARYFRDLTPNIYRFMPVTLIQADLSRVHGMNERVSISDYLEGIRFYRTLMTNMGAQ